MYAIVISIELWTGSTCTTVLTRIVEAYTSILTIGSAEWMWTCAIECIDEIHTRPTIGAGCRGTFIDVGNATNTSKSGWTR
jgi:hypothetical protein